MKKLFTAIALCLSLGAFAQESNRTEEYVELLARTEFLSSKITVTLDYGQERKFMTDARIKDETGKVTKFNSVIDALNYMNGEGWEFVHAFPVTHSNTNVYHYLMKRKVKTEAISTK